MNEPTDVLRTEAQQRLQLANHHGGWEGTHTDFKRELGSKLGELAKLVRHILAFANTPRRTDAYIIFGVNENKSLKAFDHVGVSTDGFPQKERIDELVRRYTKVKGVFVDDSFLVDGKRTPYLVIPMQYEGPYTLTQSLSGLDPGIVYCRYGSLSAPATERDERRMKEDWEKWFVDCRYAESATTLVAALTCRFPMATAVQDCGPYVRLVYNSSVYDEFGSQTTQALVHAYWGFEPIGPDAVESLACDHSTPAISNRKLVAARFTPSAQERANESGIRFHPLHEIYFVNDSYALLCREFLHNWEDERANNHLNFVIDLDYRPQRDKAIVAHSILSFLEKQVSSSERVAIVVHGDFGCGKSTTAKELVAQLSREYLRGNLEVPKVIYLDVNNMDIRSRRDDCIESQLFRLRMSRDHVDRLVAQVRLHDIHLVFDGVDEMARPYTADGRKEAMQILAGIGNRAAAAYFVRSSYFPEIDDMLMHCGILATHDLEAGEQRVVTAEIMHLRDEQIVKYLDDRLGRIEGSALRGKLHKLNLTSFLRDPLILAMIVEYGIESVDAVAEEDRKARFLSNLVLRLVDREQVKRQWHGEFAANVPLFLRILRVVAFSMVCRGYSMLSSAQLVGFVERALDGPKNSSEMVNAFRTMSWIHRSETGGLEFRHEALTIICAAEHISKALEKRDILDLGDWQEAAPLADLVCQYAGRILRSSGFLGAVAILGGECQANVRKLVTTVLQVAKSRDLADDQKLELDARTLAKICRGLAGEPSLVRQSSKLLVRVIGYKRHIHVAVPLLWYLNRIESQDSTDAASELLEVDITTHKGGGKIPKRNFTHLLDEIKDDVTNLTDILMLKELDVKPSELLDSLNYERLFHRLRVGTKAGEPTAFHYMDRTVDAIAGERGRRESVVHQHKGKARERKKYIKAG